MNLIFDIPKKIAFVLFLLLVAAQLYVPAQMILGLEEILEKGKAYRFETAPIDPVDPFRGRYITLRYEQSRFLLADTNRIEHNQTAYAKLVVADDGFAKVSDVVFVEPEQGNDYIEVNVNSYKSKDSLHQNLFINYPFIEFYMEENMAPLAEKAYWQQAEEPDPIPSYAIIRVLDGKCVIEEVMLDGLPIADYVRNNIDSLQQK